MKVLDVIKNRKTVLDKGVSKLAALKSRTALITGSTGGIGEAFARALAAQGCNVVLNGFGDAEAIERLRAGIAQDHGVEVVYHGADPFSLRRTFESSGVFSTRRALVDCVFFALGWPGPARPVWSMGR